MRKCKKSMLMLLLSMVLCLCTVGSVWAESGSDTTAPLVTKATFVTKSVDKPTSEGATNNVQLKLSVVEEATGISRVQVGVYGYKGGNTSPVLLFGEKVYEGEDDSAYTGDIVIDIPVSKTDASAVYKVGFIEITDNAGNKREYFDHYATSGYRKDSANKEYLLCYGEKDATNACYIDTNAPTVTVKSNGDDTAPIVTGAKFLNTSVDRPGTIKLELDVIEESKLKSVDVSYMGKKGNQDILIGYSPTEFDVSENKVTSYVDVSEDNTAGDYYVESIRISDTEGNERYYIFDYATYTYFIDEEGSYIKDVGNENCKCYIKNGATVTVKSNGDDIAPIIKKVTLKTHTVKKPGILPMTLELKEADEVKKVAVKIRNCNGTEQDYIAYTKEFDEKVKLDSVTIKMPIATASELGKYYIEEILITDYSGNERRYFDANYESKYPVTGNKAYIPDLYDNTKKAYLAKNKFITLEDEFEVNFEVALSNKKLLNKIKNMPEGETGKIFIDGKGIAKAEIFKAIKGKNKTIVFYKNNYQWVFNGKDIKEAKDIKLKVTFEMVDGTEYNVSGNLLKIVFPANGVLPGKANVRIKSDYTYELYEVTEAMYLYYLNENNDKLEYQNDSDVSYLLDGTDHWCKFDITHNSTYMVSNEKIVKAKKLTITGVSKKLAAGKKMKLSVTFKPANTSFKKVKWTSSNTKYATVNSKGVVTAKKAGIGKKVTITATAKDGSKKKAKFTITIMKDSVKSVKLSANKSVKVGKSVTVKATVKATGKKANKKLRWTTSNKKYATVNSKGKVVAKKAGKGKSVKIIAYATDGSGKKATITIKIK